ncbi:monomethylamine corrinoid protein 1 [Methanosarcina sp. KYL-1]|uniref:methyltransferase cognate corrinoid protein n=1 Tax=Methanosarcina sp. KYL-1 TaxID=2602068 RepID=UPI0021015A18|nr:methyltransferase cognate corrinoid protein [Methanosarcina sp. KYL-1]MCQ1536790.1 monomethylamine corrinoid protein 1 [Methanosarcina sp. KYL-1]
MTNQKIFDDLRDAIASQNIAGCAQLTQEALDAGIPPLEMITKGLSAGMKIVGERFEAAEIFLPQIMMSAKAMEAAMKILTPELEKTKGESEGTGLAVTFVAEGDIHDIGHRLVTTMLGANGFEILDLGVDVLNETVVEEAAKHKGEKVVLVGSALMTTSMLGQKDLMDRLREEGLRDSVKCMFGGAPVSGKWIAEIGADATAENAAEAAKVALEIMQ